MTQNARHGRERALQIETAIRDLGGFPDVIAPLLGRAAAAVKDLDEPADLRVVIAYEERNKNRQSVVSAAQTRVADLAREVVGV